MDKLFDNPSYYCLQQADETGEDLLLCWNFQLLPFINSLAQEKKRGTWFHQIRKQLHETDNFLMKRFEKS